MTQQIWTLDIQQRYNEFLQESGIVGDALCNSVFDICLEYGQEEFGYEMVRCAWEVKESANNKPFSDRFNGFWQYLKGIEGDFRNDLYEVMRPYV